MICELVRGRVVDIIGLKAAVTSTIVISFEAGADHIVAGTLAKWEG